jgi:hypothetical protein
MFLIKQLLPGVLAAGLISGVLAIIGRLWKANNWVDAVAIGIGYTSGHVVTAGWPTFAPAEATQWLPYFAISFLFVGVLDTLLRPAAWVRVTLWVLCCVGILRLLLGAKFQYGWSLTQGCLWIACLAVGMLVVAGCLDAAAQRDASVALPLSLAIVAGGTGAALMLSGSMLLGQLAIVLATALGAISAAGFALPTAAKGSGSVPTVVALLSSLWLSGYFFAELPPASALLLAVATVSAPMLVRFSEGAKSWKGLLLRTAVVIVPVALSVFLAFKASPPLSY